MGWQKVLGGAGLDRLSLGKINALNEEIDDMDVELIKGNKGFTRLMNKIGAWTRQSTNMPGIPTAFPTQVNYGLFGDSTGGLAWDNIPGAYTHNVFPYEGTMGILQRTSARCLSIFSLTVTGDTWEADGTAGKQWDYTVSPWGGYRSMGTGATIRSTSQVSATEMALYYIKEPGAGTFTAELRASNNLSTLNVNGVDALVTNVNCASETLGAGKAGFCYMTVTHTGATAGKFQLGFGGQWTVDILYNDTPANVQTALEALSSVGAGNCGVTKSGSTWTILIRSANLGWKTITWRDGTTALTGYLTFGLAEQRLFKVTNISGVIRTWNPYSVNRTINGVASYNLARGGLRLGDTILWDQNVMNSILGDMKIDFASVAYTCGQAGQYTITLPNTYSPYTLDRLKSNFSTFIAKTNIASPRTDWVYQSFPPSAPDPTDAIILAANPVIQAIVEADGETFIDTYSAMEGGWSVLTDLDGYAQPSDFVTPSMANDWTGDGIHLGNHYHAFVGSVTAKQIGLYEFTGVLAGRRLNVDFGTIAGPGLDFSKGAGAATTFRLRADQTFSADAQLMLSSYNRCFQVIDKDGTIYVQFGTHNDPNTSLGTFFKNPVHFGAYNGSQILSGSGSPEGAKTAAIGSIYLRTDGAAGTSMYVKESGTGNTGWVAK